MKINSNFFGIKTSAAGLSIQRKKMNLVSENIANVNTTKTENGGAYQRKAMVVKQEKNGFNSNLELESNKLKLAATNEAHFSAPQPVEESKPADQAGLTEEVVLDKKTGEIVYMPEHPDANADGYVQMPNVNIITEMVDMIAASRSYEANLTALNNSKQMVKDTLEI